MAGLFRFLILLLVFCSVSGKASRLLVLEDRLWMFNTSEFSIGWSKDGFHWQGVEIFNYFYGIAYGQGKYVIIGYSKGSPLVGYLDTRLEDINFETQVPELPESKKDFTMYPALNGVAFGSGRFVVVGDEGVILVSEDGVKWHQVPSGVQKDLVDIVYTGAYFVAPRSDSTILLSKDGLRWQPIALDGFYELNSARHINGRTYVLGAEGGLFVSTDGRNWERIYLGPDEKLLDIAYGKGIYVLLGERSLFVSSDGVRWTKSPLPPELTTNPRLQFYNVVYFRGEFIINFSLGPEEFFLKSKDGRTWGIHRTGFETLWSVAYGNGVFVGVGDRGTILVSPDGERWTPAESGTWADLYEAVYLEGKNHFVAYGEGDILLISPDGRRWEKTYLKPGNAEWVTVQWINRVVFGNGLYLAAVRGTGGTDEDGEPKTMHFLLSSKDGRSWTLVGTFEGELWGLAYGKGVFLAIYRTPRGEDSGGNPQDHLIISQDGIAWRRGRLLLAGQQDWSWLDFVGGKFFIGAWKGDYLYVSEDGLTWTMGDFTNKTDDDIDTYRFHSLTRGRGQFVMMGTQNMSLYQMPSRDVIAFSQDGVYWTVHDMEKEKGNRHAAVNLWTDALSLTYGQDKYVAVGSCHTIWTSLDGFEWKKVR